MPPSPAVSRHCVERGCHKDLPCEIPFLVPVHCRITTTNVMAGATGWQGYSIFSA